MIVRSHILFRIVREYPEKLTKNVKSFFMPQLFCNVMKDFAVNLMRYQSLFWRVKPWLQPWTHTNFNASRRLKISRNVKWWGVSSSINCFSLDKVAIKWGKQMANVLIEINDKNFVTNRFKIILFEILRKFWNVLDHHRIFIVDDYFQFRFHKSIWKGCCLYMVARIISKQHVISNPFISNSWRKFVLQDSKTKNHFQSQIC